MDFEKEAGGPGSGVKGYNTATIPQFPRSKHVSVGTRKALLDHMDYEKMNVKVHDITHVGQEKFVPNKLQKFLKDPRLVTENSIDILVVPGEEVACIDGHHRLLAALSLGIQEIPARVYVSRNGKKSDD